MNFLNTLDAIKDSCESLTKQDVHFLRNYMANKMSMMIDREGDYRFKLKSFLCPLSTDILSVNYTVHVWLQ